MDNLLNLMEYAARVQDFDLFLMAKNNFNEKHLGELTKKKKAIDATYFEIEQGVKKPIVITIY